MLGFFPAGIRIFEKELTLLIIEDHASLGTHNMTSPNQVDLAGSVGVLISKKGKEREQRGVRTQGNLRASRKIRLTVEVIAATPPHWSTTLRWVVP